MVLLGDAEGKQPVSKPRKRWLDSIDIDTKEILNIQDWTTICPKPEFVLAVDPQKRKNTFKTGTENYNENVKTEIVWNAQ